MKKSLLFAYLAVLTASVSANASELDKFNSAKSSVSFTENKGQISDQNYNPRPDVLFSGAANGLTFHIRKDGISYQTSRVDSWKEQDENLSEGILEEGKIDSVPDQMTIYRTDINWLGFNKDYTIESGEAKAGFNNYYLPSCPEGAMNVKSYTDVTFKNLYAGVDVKWYEKNGELEYDFIVAPNTDYTKISWEIKGADRISIGENGQLIIETPLGNIEEQAPIAFQGETMVEAAWKIEGNKIGFQLGRYNENEVLIIDPVVRVWGTYYGGTGTDYGHSCATDASGNVYLAGRTSSTTGIATTGAHQTTSGGATYDAFLVKFNSSGVRQWGTYYGGTGSDYGYSCATDASGNVYLAGNTSSTTGIATTGAHQTTYGGGSNDAFLVKFNSSGVRQWGTYYGGTGYDYGLSCATDASGNVYLAGNTTSTTGIATTGAHQTTSGGGSYDAFLVKFNSSGVRQWGTYYGGTGFEIIYSCATDASGNVYLAGYTTSTTGIATTGAHQTTKGGSIDAFLVKFNSSGVRQWGTYYGGTGVEIGYSCATDASGNVYLAGYTTSTTGIATTGAHQTTYGGSYDAFLVKFNSSGVRQWGTYYGGTGTDYGRSCATDASGNVYLAGYTTSTTGIATTGAHQTTYGGNNDAFLVKFNSSGVRQWGTYYGGTGTEDGYSCATDASGNVYLAGRTTSTTAITTTGAHQTTSGGGSDDAFLVKFDACPAVYSQDTITACDSYTWIDGVIYTLSDTTAMDTLVNAAGCDSIVSLFLTINNSNTGTDIQTACDTYTWIDGVTYTASTSAPTFTLANAAGCDSVVTLDLTINNSNTGTDIQTACDTYTWIDGVTYTASTSAPTFTLANAAGCDSVVTLDLTINNSNTGTDIQTACDTYTWIDGVTYTASTSAPTFTLANAAGCDSVVTLDLTINNSNTGTDIQTACDTYTWIDGVTYTASTSAPTFTLANAAGCDSVVTLDLTINNSNTGTDIQTACDTYTWIDGVTYTASTSAPTFTLANAAGCDSVVTLDLTINNSNTGTDIQTACDTYTWIDGVTYTASTSAPTFTLANAAGCDSVVTLDLTINNSNTGTDIQTACDTYTWIDGVTYTASTSAPTFTLANAAGCDSVVTLDLTINNSNTGTDIQTACDTYTWIDGVTYTASTSAPTFTLANAAGCDSVVTLDLTINNSNTGTDIQTACDTYTWIDGVTYTASTSAPTFTLANAAGCDSVVTLDLTINNSNTGTDIQTACDTYTWIDGVTYTASTSAPTFTLANAAGCDSVVTLDLTINNSNTGTDIQTACDTYTWIDGVTYTASTSAPTFTLANAAGCDSVVTLDLTINNSNTGTDIQTACDTYTWIDGVTYTASTSAPTFTLANAAGCDSVVTLDLTINNSNTGTDIQTACDTYTWIDGVTYTASTSAPTFTLANAAGCDSVVTLDLTINNSNTGTDIQTACDTYTWIDGVTYTASTSAPTFTLANAAGCDSVVTLDLTINNSNTGTDIQTACDTYTWIDGVTYTASTSAPTFTLANAAGCDSVVTLDLTINNSNTGTDIQTACDTYTWIDGVTYTASTSAPTFTLANAAGCDSVVTLDLTINNSNTGTDIQTACDTYTWIDGVTYTASTSAPTFTLANAAGCDSVVTLDLTINNSNTGTDIQTACDTYTWIDGVTYTASTSAPTFTLANAAGCDSVVTLDLTINNSNTGTDIQTACDTYTWIDGVTYTASTSAPTFTLANAAGCDSVVTLDLTINNSNTGTDIQTACDTYTWIDGVTYTASTSAPTFTLANAAGCDSVVTLDLTIISNPITGFTGSNSAPINSPLSYSVDSIANATYFWSVTNGVINAQSGASANVTWYNYSNGTIQVTQTTSNGCSDTLIQDIVLWPLGIATMAAQPFEVSLYPNPARESINLELTRFEKASSLNNIKIFDVAGNIVLSQEKVMMHLGEAHQIETRAIAKGVYFLTLENELATETLRFILQ